MLDEYTRGFLIREIDRAQHPSGMSVHDGRVHIDASVIQRLLAIIEKLSSERNALREACVAMIEWDDREQDHAVDFGARMDLCQKAFDKARAALALGETK